MNYSDIKKKYGIGTSNSTEDKDNTEKQSQRNLTYGEIAAKYGINRNEGEEDNSSLSSSKGKEGWQKYLQDKTAQTEADKKDEKWWEKLGRWLGGGTVDTTLPTSNVTQSINDMRADTSYRSPSEDWSEDQQYEFGALYLESPEKAYKYAEETNAKNKKAQEDDAIKKIQDSATSNFWSGAAHTVGSIATAPFGLVDYLGDLVEGNARGTITPDGFVSPFEYSQAVTEGISTHLNDEYGVLDEDIPILGSKGLGDLYGLGTSIAQSMTSAYTLGSVGTLISYFGQGAAAGVDDALSRGASEEQATLYGTALGVFEGLAEQIGVERLFNIGSSSTVKGLIKNILNQAGAEGAEEGLTSLLSNIADNVIMQDKSNFNALVMQYMDSGMSKSEAEKKAWMDSIEGIAYDTIAGAVSGGVSGGLRTGVITHKANKAASEIYGSQAQSIVDDALAMDNSNVKAIGEKFQNKLNDGKSLSGWNLNELIEATDTSKVKNEVLRRLGDLGETKDVTAIADVLVKQAKGEELNSKDYRILNESDTGHIAAAELSEFNIKSGGLSNKWAEKIGTRELNPHIYNKNLYDATKAIAKSTKNTTTPTKEEERKFKASENGKTMVDGNEVSIKEIFSVKNGEITLSLENGETVNANDVEFSSNEEMLYATVVDMNLNAETANAFIRGFNAYEGLSADQYALGFREAYTYGSYGFPVQEMSRDGFSASLSESQKSLAYNLGKVNAKYATESKQSAGKAISNLKNLSNDGIINTNESEVANESGESIRLRNSSKRDGGKNTKKQVSRMESGTGQTEGRRKTARIADSEAARLVNEGREVKVANLGILGGSTEQTVRLVDKKNETSSMKEARKRAEARGLKVTFFVGDNLVIKDKNGEWISARAYIKGHHVLVRADHSLYTADQLMRHELGHDMIAKGEVDIKAVRDRLIETVGKENINKVAEFYADAYEGTGMSAEEIWEECICDSLGDMNIFAGNEDISNTVNPMLSLIKAEANESKSPTQKRGSPDGKSSRERYSKHDKALYAAGVSFLHKNFPPENERLSEAHRLATWWARNQDTVSGDQTIIVMNDIRYLVECFDDALNYYQVEDVISNEEFDIIYKEIKQNGRSGQIKSVQGSTDFIDKLYQSSHSVKKRKSSVDSDETRHGTEDSKVQRVGEIPSSGRERSSNNGSRDSQSSSEDRQKYSRELDTNSTEYKINTSMTMAEAKRMIETAYKVNGIAEYYEGEYENAEDWLKKAGSDEVEMYIENDYDLQAKYINSNEDILNEEYRISDVLDAYLAGTLIGKEKPKPKRLDVSQSTKLEDDRFYSPQKIEDAKATFELAKQKATGKDAAAINRARAEILLFAHNKGASELLGITQSELNKKLRSWSNYSATAKSISEKINAGVAEENRWTGIENSSYISKAKVTNEDIERLVASVEGDSKGYERKYIARVMLAADTHIDYSGLKFKFASSQQVNADNNSGGRVLGFYDDTNKLIEVTHDKPHTVAHEMGHYIDAQWGRDLVGSTSSRLFLTRGVNEDIVRKRYGNQGVQFLNNFKLFINSLSDVNQNSNSYYNDRKEIFARFFARFIEWTDNIATGNKYYSYESTMYNDKFTQAQYVEFARLLQEKALLDGSLVSSETKTAKVKAFDNEGNEVSRKYSRELDDEYSRIYSMKLEVNQLREEIRKIEASDDFKLQMDKLSEAVANDDVVNGVKAYEEWKKASGYGELISKRDVLLNDISRLTEEYEKKRESHELEDEKAAIAKSGLSEAAYFRKQAVKEFGYTPHFYDAGYILPNGKMLNFSGEKNSHFGTRGQDHRAIGIIYANTQGTDALVRFMNDGNIRIMAESPGLDISSNLEPTREQYSSIRSFIYEYANKEYFNIDLSDEGGHVIGSLEYEGRINPTRIINDVKHYYETGEIRAQSDVDRFRYSRELDFIDFINEQAGEESDPNLTKAQKVAKVRGELEKMNVGKGEIMAVMKLADKIFDVYGGDSSISEFRYGLFEATKLALNGSETGFDAAYDIIHTLAREVAYNPKNAGGEAELLAEIKRAIRGSRMSVHEADKTSGEFSEYGGYGAFRKSHLGKFMLANDGIQVDVKYEELQNLYGNSFFPDVNTVSEQLMQMAKLMDTPLSEYMMVSEAELEATADEMVQSLFTNLGDIWSRAIKGGKTIVAPIESDKFSNRSLLVGALETVAQHPVETEKLRQYKEQIALINSEEQKLFELRAKIKELSFKKGTKDTEAIKNLQFEANQAANRINTYDKQLLNLESTKALKGVLEREKALARKRDAQKFKEAQDKYRENAAKAQRELMNRYQESRKNAVEGRNKTAMRHKIKNVVSDLNQLLLHGSKERNVKLGLQKAVKAALEAINMDTVSAESRIAKLTEELLKAKTPEKIAEIQHSIDYIKNMGDRMSDKIEALRKAYSEIKNSADNEYSSQFKEEASLIEARIESVIEKVGDTPLRDMSLYQLEQVHDMYKMVLTTIRNANAVWKEGKLEDLQQNASAVMEEIDALPKIKDEGSKITETVRSFKWNEMTPYYAFDHIGSKTLMSFFNELIRGQDTYARDVAESKAFADEVRAKYNYKKWKLDEVHDFKLKDGRTFRTTLKHMLSIYAYSKRDQALDHMSVGGFFHNDKATFRKKGGVLEMVRIDEVGYKIDAEILAEIKSAMTSDQLNYVDEMQDYLTKMGEKGNEVTRILWGIDIFKEKIYFPLKSKNDFIKKSTETAQTVSLKNDGMTKETVPGASNPIVLEAFDDVWASHIDRMSQYHAFVIPIDNLNKIHQYGTWAGTDSMAVSTMLAGRFGSAVNDYITQFIKDMNGGVTSQGATNPFASMFSKFKKTAVGASLSTVVQQPTAIIRAMSLVDAKYFAGKPNLTKLSSKWDELKTYAPVAIIKEIGGFDAGGGKQTARWINTDALTGIDKFMNTVDDLSMKGAELADQIGWTAIWEAVKREIKATTNLKGDSKEFFEKCGERFTEVIVKTQVYDSTLSRSGFMRSKNDGVKMITAFMGEPTLAINMIYNAIINALRGGKGAKLKATRIIGCVYLSTILASVVSSAIYALNDDDEDESYKEKYLQALGGEVISDIVLAPITSLPGVKDIVSIFQGWDIERSDMAIFKDIKDAFDGLYSENKSTYRKIEDFAGAIASIFGLPVKNLLRTGREVYNAVDDIFDGIEGGSASDAFEEGVTGKEASKTKKLYEAIVNGDNARLDMFKKDYKDDDTYNNAVRKALREHDSRINEAAQARLNGNIAEYTRIAKSIIAEGNFSQDIVVGAINAQMNAIKRGETTGEEVTEDKDEVTSIYSASDINSAFDNGDYSLAKEIIKDLVETKIANGMEEKNAKSSIKSSMTSYWKSLYKEAYQSGNSTEMARIRQILYSSGLYGTANDVVKTTQNWLKS